MSALLNAMLAAIILANLLLMVRKSHRTLIRVVGFQGFLLGLFPMFTHKGEPGTYLVLFSLAVAGLKGLLFPWLLNRTCKKIDPKPEKKPFLSYNLSAAVAVMSFLLAFWVETKLNIPIDSMYETAFAAAFMTILTGLVLTIARRQAMLQVLGYLVAENGIYLFGAFFSPQTPLWLELSILLDLMTAVFVMGIAIHHISREFDSIDVAEISSIRD